MDATVALVRWPDEEQRRSELRGHRRLRLLLVDDGVVPPVMVDCLEDWVRVPAGEAEVAARTASLLARAHHHVRPGPQLVDGLLRDGDATFALAPLEARLLSVLLDKRGTVVSRDALVRAGWPGGAPTRNALDVHVLRLRRRLTGHGLSIRTVRSRGYLLDAEPESSDVTLNGFLPLDSSSIDNPSIDRRTMACTS